MNISIIKNIEKNRHTIIDRWYLNQFNDEVIKKYRIHGFEEKNKPLIIQMFLEPLLNLLIAYLRTGDDRYRLVYLDERLRYAPHRSSLDKRVEFFRSILSEDEASLIDTVPLNEKQLLRDALCCIHGSLMEDFDKAKPPVHLLSLGDCLMNEIRVFILPQARQEGIPLDMRILYFSAAMNCSLSVEEVVNYLRENKVDLIGMSFLSFQGIPAYSALLHDVDKLSREELERRVIGIIALIQEFLITLRKHTSVPFLVHDVGGLPLGGIRLRIPLIPAISRQRKEAIALLNKGLEDLSAGISNCIILRESEVTAREGHRTCSKPLLSKSVVGKGFYHTSIFGSLMASQYVPVLKAYHLFRKTKLFLVDFDNTLWEGVMADGPVLQYVEKQKMLRRLKDAGLVLVALSKNTIENIRWDEMVLKPDDFVSLKINWNLKAQSIQEVATELNLGMDSFVFLDDNPVELELVRQACPKVVTLDSLDTGTWSMLELLFYFPITQETEESRARTEMYRAQISRQRSLVGELDYPEMMRSLGLSVRFGEAKHADLDRLTELINRTNQFNTTGVRYSKTDLEKFQTDSATKVYVGELEDKFGKLGLVTAAIVKNDSCDRVIVSFVMSCRAMGFGLENLMLRKIVEADKAHSGKVVGRFIPTDRNSPSASFYKNNGFEMVNDTDWQLSSGDVLPSIPSWFTVGQRV